MDQHPEYPALVLTLQEEIFGITPLQAAALIRELYRYFCLLAAFPNVALSPSPVVDRAWHALMLMPRFYYKACEGARRGAVGMAR